MTTLKAFRIDWMESESGWGQKPDGYSVHTTIDAASAYLSTVHARLPEFLPDAYSYPDRGWSLPAYATPVLIPAGGVIAKALAMEDSVRIFDTFDDKQRALYREAGGLEAAGEPVHVNYSVRCDRTITVLEFFKPPSP